MKMKRRGGRKVVVLPDNNNSSKIGYELPLATVVARAYCWQELFLSGKYASITELANQIGLDRSYVSRIMRLALLAPDIIESIMTGSEPGEITFKKLTARPVPVEWNKQREMFGFTD